MEEDLSTIFDRILNDQEVRRAVTSKSFLWFLNVYFADYITHPFAPFQKEMIRLAEDESIQTLGVVAFRGSAKSTILNMAYAIWSILGKQQKKFVLIVSHNQQQVRQHLKNIKSEFEQNELLRKDLGPFEEQDDEWRSISLTLPKYRARITALSIEQSLRGIRHGSFRPDLIICDDIEDLASVKTLESRDRTHNWLTSELLPAGDSHTRFVIIGNLLHEDSVMMRIKTAIGSGSLTGVFKEYPLIGSDGQCLWTGKYPDQAAIEKEKLRIGNESAWQREMNLVIVTNDDRVIYLEWIHYYDELPDESCRFTAMGVDLAISEKTSADFTAIVSAKVYGYGEDRKIYILPSPTNRRMSHLTTLDTIKNQYDSFSVEPSNPKIFIEDVGYQSAVIEHLNNDGYPAVGSKPHGQDKRSRIALTSHLVQGGKVLFPRHGSEKLVQQLTGFGMERHDDLADAFAIVVNEVNAKKDRKIGIACADYFRPSIDDSVQVREEFYRGLQDFLDQGLIL